MAETPLRRNRDFVLLQMGQFLSSAGTASTQVAYPLLVLVVTHSAAKAGVVGFARTLPSALLALPAGLAADRWSRRRLMIGADGARLLALGGLATAILAGHPSFALILVVALVEGAGGAVFSGAQVGALRAVVPAGQLPAAVSAATGREAVVRLGGPPLGGALFGLARALPFVADAASYAVSSLSLLAMRTPFEEAREPDMSRLRTQVVEGLRYLWSRPFLRTCALLFGIGNFIAPGLLLAVVVIGKRQGLSGGEIGGLVGAFGVCLLAGSFLSSTSRRLLPVRAILVLELWTWLACGAFLVWPSVYVLMGGLLLPALVIPSTDSVVHGYRIAMTPDRLLGRAESAWRTISLLIAPLGPLVAGLLLGTTSPRATIAVFTASVVVLAMWGTLSPAIRSEPPPKP